jgi:signal transduction histidine kinase
VTAVERNAAGGVPATRRSVVVDGRADAAAADGDVLELGQQLRAAAEASERRLRRLSFDLHDGVLQDVVALLMDLRLLRSHIRPGAADPSIRDVRERLENFEERLDAIEGELRAVAQTLGAMTVPDVGGAIRKAGELLASGAGIAVDVEVSGDVHGLTESQQIAILRIAQGAFANIRQHSRATAVSASLAITDGAASLCIRDNGCGFDAPAVFAGAAPEGSLGLFAMRERVRLLGGHFAVESRRGLTEVSVTLPPWRGARARQNASRPQT